MDPANKRRIKRALIAAAVLAPLIVAVDFALNTFVPRRLPGSATGDPLDIRLAGVYLPNTTAVYDAAGKKIADAPGDPNRPRSEEPSYLSRTFVFKLPAGSEGAVFFPPHDCHISIAGRKQMVQLPHVGVLAHVSTRVTEFALHDGIVREYTYTPFGCVPFRVFPFIFQRPLREVDVTLFYHYGPRGPAQLTFTGPFEIGRTCSSDGAGEASLTLSRHPDPRNDRDLMYSFRTETDIASLAPPVIYDSHGPRERINTFRLRSRDGETTFFSDVPPADITAVTFGEKPREKTFHRIRVIP